MPAPLVSVPEGYFTITAWASWYRIPRSSADNWIHKGLVPYLKIGTKRFIKRETKPPGYKGYKR